MIIQETAETIRHNWHNLSQAQIADLEARGVIENVVDATFTSRVIGNNYSGNSHTRRVYVCGEHKVENIVGEVQPFRAIENLDPNNMHAVAGYLVQHEPGIQAALIEQNGGNFPQILSPVIPEPPAPVLPEEPEVPAEPDQPVNPE
ncbi:hypothetical protein [Arsenicibacter rosenii]|uniref:Uncharacterized protein n=1 Tax=Arsenicibacter rosenii TaxID=1750698 RepID=A0A1S2V9W0_9BACT|nr:hypothetical protein [Arsenicibacter rosenii]OIN55524.1 hypothetical protein BLX24_29770 [Arsenicibacter rosenii]